MCGAGLLCMWRGAKMTVGCGSLEGCRSPYCEVAVQGLEERESRATGEARQSLRAASLGQNTRPLQAYSARQTLKQAHVSAAFAMKV